MKEQKLKSGYIAIVGRPNVGKSTLMNALIGQKIAITSSKPQTTRNKIQTVYTDERGQMIFLDTPGMNKARNKLGDYMLSTALSTIRDADVILWIVEPSTYIGEMEQFIVEELKKIQYPILLVINKVDMTDAACVAQSITLYKDVLGFSEIIPVSAKTGKNIEELIKVIFQYLPEGPLYFDQDTLTDQPMKQLAAEIIREKSLYCLENEVPHGIAVVVEKYTERIRNQEGRKEPITDIEATIICEKDSHKGIIIGKGGQMLKKIGTAARHDLEDLVQGKVNLKLWVKVKKDWRDSDTQLRNFGYDDRRP